MKQIIQTEAAPSAIGPYSQAVRIGNTLYLSGQIPLKKISDSQWAMVESSNFNDHLKQIFDNIAAIAEAAGSSLEQVVKLTVYLTDMAYFSQVNEIMTQYYKPPYPVRTVIAVRELPKDAIVEVDATLVLDWN